jgi:hypothetical protein
MSYFDLHKDPFIDALDKVIIEVVRYKQFMTSKEVWMSLTKQLPDTHPSLVHQRVNRLVKLGILGCIEQDIGNAVLRRFYCFNEDPDYPWRQNFPSFLENDKI